MVAFHAVGLWAVCSPQPRPRFCRVWGIAGLLLPGLFLLLPGRYHLRINPSLGFIMGCALVFYTAIALLLVLAVVYAVAMWKNGKSLTEQEDRPC